MHSSMWPKELHAVILRICSISRYIPSKVDRIHFKECLIEMLQDMFGEDSVPRTFSGDVCEVEVSGTLITII